MLVFFFLVCTDTYSRKLGKGAKGCYKVARMLKARLVCQNLFKLMCLIQKQHGGKKTAQKISYSIFQLCLFVDSSQTLGFDTGYF